MTRISDSETKCPLCSGSTDPMQPHPEAELFRCKICSHAFTKPESVKFSEQYGPSYFEEDHKRWFEYPNISLFRTILADIPHGASLADVGCGRGDFLRFARRHRPDLLLSGIDLSPNSEESGINFICGDIMTDDIGAHFDVVVSLAVIEHIPDVQLFVERLGRLGRPGATAIIMTLNDGSLLYTAARLGRWLGATLAFDRIYSTHHFHHFTRESLASLLSHRGYAIRKHLDHNAPVKAMDFPVKNRVLDSVLRLGLHVCWIAGRAMQRSYLQTVFCEIVENELPRPTKA